MSLPPGFLDELRTRASIAQVVGRKVMWDMRKSNQGKGDMWAPCPFHHEKTASFHVDDKKGYYYCFGCHAKGDALKFICESENVSFMEAVEILAGEVGMPMPARDPKAREKADKHSQLREVMEQAVQFYRLQLKTRAAAEARAYLGKRGLSEEALARWEIGFAPDGWQTLWDHLTGKGVAEKLILDAGLAKPSRNGGKPYDVFRNRILFPIRDGRGRAIAFGGRAMDPSDNAKYLNSPATEIFDKSRNLYNLGPAREAAGKGQPLIVAEGYMDVIALAEAGFGAAVAPLGTAVTEPQLQLMWRMADEPVIALDGDTAGLRAAGRVMDLALPLLQSGKSLRFALMPEGQDPDDLLRANGPEAVRTVLEAAQPLVKLLWQQATEGRVFDSPERKAALDKALRDKTDLITDPVLRGHYEQDLKDLRWALFRKPRQSVGPRFSSKWTSAPVQPVAATRGSALVGGDASVMQARRIDVILALLLTYPELVAEFDVDMSRLPVEKERDQILRDLLMAAQGDATKVQARARSLIGDEALETLMAARHVKVLPCLQAAGRDASARLTVEEEFDKLFAELGWRRELEEAQEDLEHLPDESVTFRLAEAARAKQNAGRRRAENDADYEIAPNGATIDREERSAFDALLEQISFEKNRRN